jgi:2-dehydro-3-deoxyphosphogluconate aldolase/(4S)-4-hydroxy-2-oxoglutarate aldolase
VIQAMDLGLSVVKLFPASSAGGPAYLRTLGGPFPGLRFVPTGGIEAADLAAYLGVPSVLAVGGSWMVRPGLLLERDWAAVGRLASEASEVVRTVRPPAP